MKGGSYSTVSRMQCQEQARLYDGALEPVSLRQIALIYVYGICIT